VRKVKGAREIERDGNEMDNRNKRVTDWNIR
jgi:hypothetical protein